MSRTFSSVFQAALMAQETGEVVVALLTITHADLATPIRLSSDPTVRISTDPLLYATTSRGNDFTFLPFTFTLPEDKSGAPPRVELVFDNINRSMVALLRSVSTPVSVLLELVLASSPNIVELALPAMQMAEVQISEDTISVSLVIDHLINEPFPAGTFSPGAFPGLF